MSFRISEEAYKKLIDEDLEWLEKQEDNLEKQHIEAVLRWSPYEGYHKVDIDNTRKYLTEKFGKEVGDSFYYAAINGQLV